MTMLHHLSFGVTDVARSGVTIEPVARAAIISSASLRAPMKLVPVEPPHFRPMTPSSQWIAAIEAASGARIIRSTTLAKSGEYLKKRRIAAVFPLKSDWATQEVAATQSNESVVIGLERGAAISNPTDE